MRHERDDVRSARIDKLNAESGRTTESQPDRARDAALDAYRLAARIGYDRGMADSLFNQGLLHAHAADYPNALECFHAAFLGYQRGGLTEKLPLLQRKLGNIHLITGQYAKAEARFMRSLALSRKAGAVTDEIISLRQLGIVEQFRGRVAAAAARYHEAHGRAAAAGERNQEANALMDLGSLRLESGDPEKAMTDYERCRTLWTALGDSIGLAQTGCNLGMALTRLKRFDEAEKELRAALATSCACKAARLELNILTNLGELFTASARPADSARTLGQALKLARRQKDRHIELALQLALARLAESRGKVKAALKLFAEAKSLAEAIGESEALVECKAANARLAGVRS
jgi:tetratricopeptide (TPR) repeat protein